jgi:hypothetical protein
LTWKPGETGNPKGRPRRYPQVPPGIKGVGLVPDEVERRFRKAVRDRNWKSEEELRVNGNENVGMSDYRRQADQLCLMDPVLYQHKLLSDESLPTGLRANIAASIAPYYRPKLGSITPARMIETPIEVPAFQTVADAEKFLLRITNLVATGKLSLDSGMDLTTIVRTWISAKHQATEVEIKQANASIGTGRLDIHISGGLPSLPGTEVIMPKLAREPDDLVLEATPEPPSENTGSE